MLWRTALTVGLTALAAVLGSPSIGAQGALAVLVFLTVGLPHGALDHVVARRTFGIGAGGLYLGYLAVAGLAFSAWCTSPLLATIGFFGVSAWHFGEGDLRGLRPRPGWGPVLIVSRGGLILGSLLWAWPEFGAEWFGPAFAEIPGWYRTPATPLLLGGQHALAALLCLDEPISQRARIAAEAFVLSGWLWMAEPLLAFSLYFGLWHSWDHLALLRGALAERGMTHWATVWSRGFPNALASALALCVLAAVGLTWVDGATVWSAALAGLGAIATPHLLLVEGWRLRANHLASAPTRS